MLRTVAVIVQSPVALFELGVLAEVFGVDRTDDGVPAFDHRVCAEHPGDALPAGPGTTITAAHPLTAVQDADLVAVVCSSVHDAPSVPLLDAIRTSRDRGVPLLAFCTGTFALAHAGVLDGRRVAAHWRHADELRQQWPQLTVDADVLYFKDGSVITCAGTASGIDACLHIVRSELGPAVANRIARRMVVPGFRSGQQRQQLRPVLAPSEDDRSIQPLLQWCEDRLDQRITSADMAAAAHVSERTLLRRFDEQVGISPHQWLVAQRIARAQELLAHSTATIDAVARQSGFDGAAGLRHHFAGVTGMSPSDYRRSVTD